MDAHLAKDSLGTPADTLLDADIMRLFRNEHLTPTLRGVSARFEDLMAALLADESVARDSQFRHGVQKLVEAKDCFVRAALP